MSCRTQRSQPRVDEGTYYAPKSALAPELGLHLHRWPRVHPSTRLRNGAPQPYRLATKGERRPLQAAADPWRKGPQPQTLLATCVVCPGPSLATRHSTPVVTLRSFPPIELESLPERSEEGTIRQDLRPAVQSESRDARILDEEIPTAMLAPTESLIPHPGRRQPRVNLSPPLPHERRRLGEPASVIPAAREATSLPDLPTALQVRSASVDVLVPNCMAKSVFVVASPRATASTAAATTAGPACGSNSSIAACTRCVCSDVRFACAE